MESARRPTAVFLSDTQAESVKAMKAGNQTQGGIINATGRRNPTSTKRFTEWFAKGIRRMKRAAFASSLKGCLKGCQKCLDQGNEIDNLTDLIASCTEAGHEQAEKRKTAQKRVAMPRPIALQLSKQGVLVARAQGR